MLRCAVDIRSSSIRMALWAFWGNDLPARLEARVLPSRSSTQVLSTLDEWRHWYCMDNGLDWDWPIVGCATDDWPTGLAYRLESAGFTIQWIENDAALSDGVELMKFLQMSPRFMRATLMAHWPSQCDRNDLDGTVFEVQYSILRRQVMDLEHDLFVEGRLKCPGHLMNQCPNCEFLVAFESPSGTDDDNPTGEAEYPHALARDTGMYDDIPF